MAAACNQQRIWRVDDEQVLRAQGNDDAVGGVNEGALALNRQALAVNAVALLVCWAEVGHGVPAANVAPGTRKRHHGHLLVTLHYGVVDAVGAAGGECFRFRTDELLVLAGLRHGLLAALQNVGRVLLQCLKQCARLCQKNARVPEHVALQYQRLGCVGIGLFNEPSHFIAAIATDCALFNIAIGRAGKAGHHAKGNNGALAGRLATLLHHGGKGLCIGNVVI